MRLRSAVTLLALFGGLATNGVAFAQEPKPTGNASAPSPSGPATPDRTPEGGAASPPATTSSPLPSSSAARPSAPAASSAPVQGATADAEGAPVLRPVDTAEVATGEGGKGKKHKGKGDKGKDRDHPTDRDNATPLGERGRFGAIQLKGRIYARTEYDRRTVTVLNDQLVLAEKTIDSMDISVPVARLGFHYHAPVEWLSAVIEIGVSGKPKMKDGYVQAKAANFAVRAGQFKMPVSNTESRSPWTLPMVRRGLLHEVLTDRLDYGGRRPGVTVGWHDRELPLRPRFTVGAFQGSILTKDLTAEKRDMELIDAQQLRGHSLVARAEIEVHKMEVGAYYEDRIGSPVPFQSYRYWTAGVDAHFDHVFENGGLRIWLDGIAGASWYELSAKTPDRKDPMFVMARAIVAYRFGGTVDEAFYVEPFALGGAIDPDADVTSDLLWEGAFGVNVGLWNRARLTLQGEVNKGQRNFPTGYFGGPPPDRLGLILQAGVAF